MIKLSNILKFSSLPMLSIIYGIDSVLNLGNAKFSMLFYQKCLYRLSCLSTDNSCQRALTAALLSQTEQKQIDGFLPPPLSIGALPLPCRFHLPPARPAQMGSLPPAPAPPHPPMRRHLHCHLAEGTSYAAQSKNRPEPQPGQSA